MPSIVSRNATPLISGLFIVSLVSGVALFFHFGSSYFHGMHEWLSVVLIVPFVLHLWKNWRPFANYFKRGPMAVSLVASLAAAMVFVVPGAGPDLGRCRRTAAARRLRRHAERLDRQSRAALRS